MDLEKIKNLVELMVANDLSRLEIQEGETHILLRRGPQGPILTTTHAPAAVMAAPAAVAAPSAATPAATASAASAAEERVIRSPMVGTFYTAPDPDSPAFAKVGDVVGPDSVVCIVEAMKVFNEIKAETSGRIARVLVKNAEAVEYDQPLFALAPA